MQGLWRVNQSSAQDSGLIKDGDLNSGRLEPRLSDSVYGPGTGDPIHCGSSSTFWRAICLCASGVSASMIGSITVMDHYTETALHYLITDAPVGLRGSYLRLVTHWWDRRF